MKAIPKIGFCVIYHPFEEKADKAEEIEEESLNLLKGLKNVEIVIAKDRICNVSSAENVGIQFKQAEVDVICIKLATWSSDDLVLDLNSIHNVPFIFWSYPHVSAGSLCGSHQFNMVFKELGLECISVYKDDQEALVKIKDFARVIKIKNDLKRTRVGQIGHRTQGMAEVNHDEFSVKKILGPRIVSLSVEKLKNKIDSIPLTLIESKWTEISKNIQKISVSNDDGLNSIKNYLALKQIIEEHKLSGITIECYPDFMGEVCLGFSLLGDQGVAGACEGDINSLVLMLILMKLSGSPVHDIDLLSVDEENNSLLGSHCGSGSFQLAETVDGIELANVRLAKKGLCVLFHSKPGKVTLANLVGREGTYRLGVIEGEAIKVGMEFPGNPIRIKLPLDISQFLKVIEQEGIGHHWIVAYGNFKNSLELIAKSLNIKFIGF